MRVEQDIDEMIASYRDLLERYRPTDRVLAVLVVMAKVIGDGQVSRMAILGLLINAYCLGRRDQDIRRAK